MQQLLLKNLIFIFSVNFILGCQNNQRGYFKDIGDERVYFDSLNWWQINRRSFTIYDKKYLYKTKINILKYQIDGYSFFDNDAFYMCESKSIKSCEKTFDFSAKKNENVSLSDNLIIKYLLRNGDTFYFEVTEKGNFSDIQDSRISIWAMSENLGIVGVAYFDNYFCKFNIISTNQPEAFEDIEKELCH